MKILWIVNPLLKRSGERVLGKRQNGVWMDALLDCFSGAQTELSIATCAPVKTTMVDREDGVNYYVLPNDFPINYNENDKKNIVAWQNLLNEVKPDLIQVWGTEFSHGLCVLRIAKEMGIPSIIYMQGYLWSIYRHYLAGISKGEIRKNITFRDIVKRDNIFRQQNHYKKQSKKEREMIALAGNVIVENDWCEDSLKSIVSNLRVYRLPLSINRVFANYTWNIEKVERFSIVSNASGYTIKGLHNILRAVSILKDRFPQIKLYVPGEKVVLGKSIKDRLRRRGYSKYIEKLIDKLNLKDTVVWLGNISQEELAERYSKSNVFVLGSAIENHSSSLKEAMMVGVPSVASMVGGIPEYVENGKNGFLYRFEEVDIMARRIERIFEDDSLAKSFSLEARKNMRELHENVDYKEKLMSFYEQTTRK